MGTRNVVCIRHRVRNTLRHLGMGLLCLAIPLIAAQPAMPGPFSKLGTGSVEGGDLPPEWVDFVGKGESFLDDQRLPLGAVVRAYDPIGVLAGRAEVTLAGWYLVSVYGDDPLTTDLDEGAESGDLIAFTVNDHPAVAMGPDPPVWVPNPPASGYIHVELQSSTLPGDFDCDCRVTVADLMRQAGSIGASPGQTGYYPPFDRDGDEDIDSRDLEDVVGGWRRTGCQR